MTEREYITPAKARFYSIASIVAGEALVDMLRGPHEALMQHAMSNQTLQPTSAGLFPPVS